MRKHSVVVLLLLLWSADDTTADVSVDSPVRQPQGSLQSDPKLQVVMKVDWNRPAMKDVLARLGESTAMTFSADDSIDVDARVAVSLIARHRAWKIMDDLAAKHMLDARWEKTDDGYRLINVGKNLPLRTDPEPAKKKPTSIRADPDLQVRFTIYQNKPPLEELLALLRTKTGLEFSLDPKLSLHNPDFGDVQLVDAPAWSVMNMLAQVDLANGRWEKVEGEGGGARGGPHGYRLTADASLRERPAPPDTRWRTYAVVVVLGLAGFCLLGGSIYYVYRTIRHDKLLADAAKNAPPDPANPPLTIEGLGGIAPAAEAEED